MVPNSKDNYSMTPIRFTLHLCAVLNALVRKSSKFPEFNKIHSVAMFLSKIFAELHRWDLVLLKILFVKLKVKF